RRAHSRRTDCCPACPSTGGNGRRPRRSRSRLPPRAARTGRARRARVPRWTACSRFQSPRTGTRRRVAPNVSTAYNDTLATRDGDEEALLPRQVAYGRPTVGIVADARIVIFLFTDLVGSTELYDRLGDETAEALRRAHFRLLREAVTSLRGHEV